jgi:hypothetical protein
MSEEIGEGAGEVAPEREEKRTGDTAAPGDGAGNGTTTNGAKRHRLRRTRGVIAWVLIVLASLLIPISVISAWAITTITNTDQYVATMAPLARNPVIIDHLATKATDALFSTHKVQDKVTEVLPAKAKPIVPPIVSQVKSYTHGLAVTVMERPRFGTLFDRLNRHTHDAVVDVLTGKQTALTKKFERGGAIVLNLTPALNQIIDEANSRGITLFNPLKPLLDKGDSLSLTIVSKSQVSQFSGIFNLMVKLRWVIPFVALALGILSIVIAVQRRRTLLRLSVGVALFTLVLLAVLSVTRGRFLGQAVARGANRDVSAAVWDTLLRFLMTNLRWMLLAAVLVAFVAWLFGPARYAVWIRSHCARAGRWLAAQARELWGGAGRAAAGSERAQKAGGWIVEHLNLLRVAGVFVAGLILVFGGNLTGWSILVIVIVLAVYLGLLQLVAAWARKVSGAVTSPGSA